MFELTTNLPTISLDVVTPDREFDFSIVAPDTITFEVNTGVADSSTDLSLIYQIALL